MLLKSLQIQREYWVTAKPLKGSIEFEDGLGEIKLVLDEEQCKKMLVIVADAMVIATKRLASDLTANIIAGSASVPQLTQQEEPQF